MTYTIQLPIPSNIRQKNVSYRYPGNIERQYTILNYNSGELSSNEFPRIPETDSNEYFTTPENPNPSIYRSVILDTNTQIPLSFSPVKSIPFAEFVEKYPTSTKDIQITEMIEGTMINLFYDKTVGSWQIATKNAVGGHYWYFNVGTYGVEHQSLRPDVNKNVSGTYNPTIYNPTISNPTISNPTISKTFRKMFYDALHADYETDLSDIPFIANMDRTAVYSFVLQHPENHLVFHIEHPILVLVSIFVITPGKSSTPNTYTVKWIPQDEYIDIIPDLYTYSGMVNVPEYIIDPTWISYVDKTSTLATFHYGNKQGYVVSNLSTGERTKLDNPEYLYRKELRGNHPHLHYQYLAVVRMGKVHEFLHYFPLYSHMFRQFYRQYHMFITDVHTAYVSYYIHRNTETLIPKRLVIHAARIHYSIYIPSLSTTQKTIIKRKVVQAYFDKMDPREILFSMYYHESK